MRKQDIKVGEEYAETSSPKWGTPARVRVIRHVDKVKVGWRHSGTPGVEVAVLHNNGEAWVKGDGEDWIKQVPNRQIIQDWASHAEAEAVKKKRADERAQQIEEETAKQAKFNKAIVEAAREQEIDLDYTGYFERGETAVLSVSAEVLAKLLGVDVEATA